MGLDNELEDWEPQEDYRAVPIPEQKPRSDYGTYARRADLYNRIKNQGFGGLPSYQDLAEEYGLKSANSIQNDIDELRKYMLKEVYNHKRFRSELAESLRWALKKAQREGDYKAAPRIAKELREMAQSVGIEDKEPDRHEVKHEGDTLADRLHEFYEAQDDD